MLCGPILYKNAEIIMIEELLGLEVEHLNRHLGHGIIVNAYISCYEGNYSNITVDIVFGSDTKDEIDFIEYLNYGFLRIADESISHDDILLLQQDTLARLKEEEELRLQELKEFERSCKITRTKFERNLLRDEVFHYFIDNRKITELVHFTPTCNLKNILEQGILPRDSVNPGTICLDSERRDGLLDFSCFSVSMPNWAMFYKYRLQHQDMSFAVISVSPEILHDKDYDDILYTQNNAAAYKYRGSLLMHKGLSYAKTMFEDRSFGDDESYRETMNLPKQYTTDAQAEVLIHGIVKNQYIQQIYFQDEDALSSFAQDITEYQKSLLKVDDSYFQRRNDWKYYKMR